MEVRRKKDEDLGLTFEIFPEAKGFFWGQEKSVTASFKTTPDWMIPDPNEDPRLLEVEMNLVSQICQQYLTWLKKLQCNLDQELLQTDVYFV